MDPGDLAADTSGTRSYAAFIVEVAQSVPSAVVPSVRHLLPHLNGEVRLLPSWGSVDARLTQLVSHDA